MNSNLIPSLSRAFDYLHAQGTEIPLDIQLKARQFGVIKAAGDFAGVNKTYHDAITAALTTFFEGGSIAAPRNAFKRAIVEGLGDAFDLGWADGGGELPIDEDALSWLNARIEQEFGLVEMLFQAAKELRKEDGFDYFPWVTARADGYTGTLQAVYNAAKMLAAKGKLLTWVLGNTEKHCATCLQLNGTRHRASWYIANNYIPRQPGAGMECGGYNCDCVLTDNAGHDVTI